jgi:superfamily II DNA/RNA helicase
MISHLNQGYVKISELEVLILDEADRMLDMGFFDDIMNIISYLPKKRINLLFAATMPPKIRQLAQRVLDHPAEINIAVSKPAENVLQQAFIVFENQKLPLIQHLLQDKKLNSVIVFCSTKKKTREVYRALKGFNFRVNEIHSDLDQPEREAVMLRFRSREIQILVATDIISRGIDVENIELIINYDVPHEGEDYIHRIGRTARAESDGIALTFIGVEEQEKFSRIEALLGGPVRKGLVPAELGPVPEYNPVKNRSRNSHKPFGRQDPKDKDRRRPFRKKGPPKNK